MTNRSINKSQAQALRQLAPPGHFRVGGTRGLLSEKDYLDLRSRGYLEEHWTWASTTRPDCGISEAGVAALARYDALPPEVDAFPATERDDA